MADHRAILVCLIGAMCCVCGMASYGAFAQDTSLDAPPLPPPRPPGPVLHDPQAECRLPAPIVTTPEILGAFVERSIDFGKLHAATASKPPPVRDLPEKILHLAELKIPKSLRNSDSADYATVLVSLSEAGRVRETLLVCSTHSEFGEAAVDAAFNSKYTARSINGIPVDSWFPQRFSSSPKP